MKVTATTEPDECSTHHHFTSSEIYALSGSFTIGDKVPSYSLKKGRFPWMLPAAQFR